VTRRAAGDNANHTILKGREASSKSKEWKRASLTVEECQFPPTLYFNIVQSFL
jgi:hypothetical protein